MKEATVASQVKHDTRRSSKSPAPKSVRFTKTDKPGAYVTETEYDNSGDGPYKSPVTGIHLPSEDVNDTLATAFRKIEDDPTLNAKEKRTAKAKLALNSKK